jgi:hypothetical protein
MAELHSPSSTADAATGPAPQTNLLVQDNNIISNPFIFQITIRNNNARNLAPT